MISHFKIKHRFPLCRVVIWVHDIKFHHIKKSWLMWLSNMELEIGNSKTICHSSFHIFFSNILLPKIFCCKRFQSKLKKILINEKTKIKKINHDQIETFKEKNREIQKFLYKKILLEFTILSSYFRK